jgi:hypothetical protein
MIGHELEFNNVKIGDFFPGKLIEVPLCILYGMFPGALLPVFLSLLLVTVAVALGFCRWLVSQGEGYSTGRCDGLFCSCAGCDQGQHDAALDQVATELGRSFFLWRSSVVTPQVGAAIATL